MGRIKTVSAGLPRNLGRDCRTNALRYKRPDTGRYVYLSGVPEDQAVTLAETANEAFGAKPPRGMRHLYRQQFLSFRWSSVAPALLQVFAVKFPDIMPMQRGLAKQEQIRHSWAYDLPGPEAMRGKLRPIKATEITQITRALLLSSRKNAKARGISFDLTESDLEAIVTASNGRCAVTGISLSSERGVLPEGRKMRRPWAPSLDRIDSAKGYAPGNCRIVCCAANYAMSQWGEGVLVEMAKAIARRKITRLSDSIG